MRGLERLEEVSSAWERFGALGRGLERLGEFGAFGRGLEHLGERYGELKGGLEGLGDAWSV